MTRRRGVKQLGRVAWVCLLFGAGMGACAQIIGADPVAGLLPSGDGGSASTDATASSGDGASTASSAAGQGGASSTGDVASSTASSSGTGVPAPTCTDGVKNGDETGTDCGGATCPKCAICTGCAGPNDCESGCCTQGICTQHNDGCAPEPTCSDGCQDGNETDVDCGGMECNSPCDIGKGCKLDTDCSSGTCSAGICVEPPPVP
jgi:hypothetical protein